MICVIFVMIRQKQKHQLNDIYQMLDQYGHVDGYQYTIHGRTYQLYVVRIAQTKELIINSPTIWEVFGGNGSKLLHQNHLRSDTEKIVIVYPNVTPIKRYINENEMIFISYRDVFHHMRVIRINELESFLQEA